MALYLVRHSPTALNDEAAPRFRGWIDVPIDALGKRLARATARFLATKSPDLIVASDLIRAIQTAREIAKPTDAPFRTDPALRPWDIGYLSGEEVTPERRAQMQLFQAELPDTPIPGGEPYNDFLARWGHALNGLLALAQVQTVVAVAHHRNALSLPTLLKGEPAAHQGPPEPAGVLEVTPTSFREVFAPPNHHRGTGTGS